jgi:hypothetical protein
MRLWMIGLTGLGQVNLLSGRIRHYQVGFGSATRCTPVNPLGCSTGRLGHAGPTRAVRSAGPRRIWPKADFQLRNSFSFSNLFCKLQSNLNSHQIWISMTSTRTIKYKSTSSHQEKYATAWMQQIIIYLNVYILIELYSFRKPGCYKPTPIKMNLVPKIRMDRKRNLETLHSTLPPFAM